jgi:hypothetical protein
MRHGPRRISSGGFSLTASARRKRSARLPARPAACLIAKTGRDGRRGYERDKTHLARDRRRSVLSRSAAVDQLEIRYCRRAFDRASRLRGRRRYRSVRGTHCPFFHPAQRARLDGLGLRGRAAQAGQAGARRGSEPLSISWPADWTYKKNRYCTPRHPLSGVRNPLRPTARHRRRTADPWGARLAAQGLLVSVVRRT